MIESYLTEFADTIHILEYWGRWARGRKSHNFCRSMESKFATAGSSCSLKTFGSISGDICEKIWCGLPEPFKTFLKLKYVMRAKVETISRACKFPVEDFAVHHRSAVYLFQQLLTSENVL